MHVITCILTKKNKSDKYLQYVINYIHYKYLSQ